MTAPQEQEMVEEEDDIGFIPLNKSPEERTTMENIDRRAARAVRRGGETILGLPGDLVQFTRNLASSFGGIEPEENLNPLMRGARRLTEQLPSSEELRAQGAEKFPQLEPESEVEEVEDEFVQDFASLLMPVKGKIPFMRSLGISAVGNLSKQGMKQMGFGEGAQNATKIGTMLFTGMFGKGRGLQKHINNLYSEAAANVPAGATFRYPMRRLQTLKSQLQKGAMTDAKREVLNFIEQIEAKAANGMMAVEEGVQFDKDINRMIRKTKGDATKRGYFKQLKGAHSEGLNEYANQNPTWGEYYNEAKQAYQGIATSLDVQDFIKKNFNLKNLAHGGVILGLEEAVLPGNTMLKLGSLTGTAASMYMAEIARRIAKNPALRRYYQNVVQASLTQNKAMLARNLNGLERTAKKEFDNNPLPEFDFEEETE